MEGFFFRFLPLVCSPFQGHYQHRVVLALLQALVHFFGLLCRGHRCTWSRSFQVGSDNDFAVPVTWAKIIHMVFVIKVKDMCFTCCHVLQLVLPRMLENNSSEHFFNEFEECFDNSFIVLHLFRTMTSCTGLHLVSQGFHIELRKALSAVDLFREAWVMGDFTFFRFGAMDFCWTIFF